MVDNSLSEYIKKALSDGFAPEEIKSALLQKGWKQKDIDVAFEASRQKPEQNSSQKTPEKNPVPSPSKPIEEILSKPKTEVTKPSKIVVKHGYTTFEVVASIITLLLVICGIIAVIFLLKYSPSNTEIDLPSAVLATDCAGDLNCFTDQVQTCNPAKVVLPSRLNIGNYQVSHSLALESNLSGEVCELKIKSIVQTVSANEDLLRDAIENNGSLTDIHLQEQFLSDQFHNAEGVCSISLQELPSIFYPGLSEFQFQNLPLANCQGPLFERFASV